MKKKKVKIYGSQSLKAHKAWRAFSLYIRARDKKCVTCGNPSDQTGHYIAGSICGKELFFSEINNNGQCAACNLWKHGNPTQYALFLQAKYGDDILRKLDKIRLDEKNQGIICRYTSEELEAIYLHYKTVLDELSTP